MAGRHRRPVVFHSQAAPSTGPTNASETRACAIDLRRRIRSGGRGSREHLAQGLSTGRIGAGTRSSVGPGPTPEELAASAATFLAPIATVDRLQLGPFDAGLPTHGMWRNGFDLADFDGDGQIDFVHGPTRRGGDQPRIFLGDGHGKWRPYRASVPPGLLDYGDVKVADFNGDGKADLAAASHLRGVLGFRRRRRGQVHFVGGRTGFRRPEGGLRRHRVSLRGASRFSTGTGTAGPISSP